MIENIKYINHLNESIEFGKNGLYVNENDLRAFEWKLNSQNDKITSFKKVITKKTLPVIIKANTDAEGIKIKNDLFELCEKDVLAKQHGRLCIGDYYLKCYVAGMTPSKYLLNKGYVVEKLIIQTDYPYWIKESLSTFNPDEAIEGKNLDYNNDFPYDYTSNILERKLINSDFVPTNFRMRIYGPATNPTVTIAGHQYKVNCDVLVGQYLIIDSIEKTINLVQEDGNVLNFFNLRDREQYIFESIPNGVNDVSASSNFIFDVTLLEERSVPKWI